MKSTSQKIFVVALFSLIFSCSKEVNDQFIVVSQTEENIATAKKIHYIGESFRGGIIFYIDSTGNHGMIAAKEDQSIEAPWEFKRKWNLTNADQTAIGTGIRNTVKIIRSQGLGKYYAALICAKYRAGGQPGWVLPSKDELNELFKQKDIVGGFTDDFYWSSTENGIGDSWYQHFGVGFQWTDDKSYPAKVRAIHYF